MNEIIEPETILEADLDIKPDFYRAISGTALAGRLGSKSTYSGYMKVVGQQDFTVSVDAGTTLVTTSAHKVASSIPFVFLYLKNEGYYTRIGFRSMGDSTVNSLSSEVDNVIVDSQNLSFSISNLDSVAQVYVLKALIFEVIT